MHTLAGKPGEAEVASLDSLLVGSPCLVCGRCQRLERNPGVGVAVDRSTQVRAVSGPSLVSSTRIDGELLGAAKDVAPEHGGVDGAFAVSYIGAGVDLVSGELLHNNVDVDVGRGGGGVGGVGSVDVNLGIEVEDAQSLELALGITQAGCDFAEGGGAVGLGGQKGLEDGVEEAAAGVGSAVDLETVDGHGLGVLLCKLRCALAWVIGSITGRVSPCQSLESPNLGLLLQVLEGGRGLGLLAESVRPGLELVGRVRRHRSGLW